MKVVITAPPIKITIEGRTGSRKSLVANKIAELLTELDFECINIDHHVQDDQ